MLRCRTGSSGSRVSAASTAAASGGCPLKAVGIRCDRRVSLPPPSPRQDCLQHVLGGWRQAGRERGVFGSWLRNAGIGNGTARVFFRVVDIYSSSICRSRGLYTSTTAACCFFCCCSACACPYCPCCTTRRSVSSAGMTRFFFFKSEQLSTPSLMQGHRSRGSVAC